LFILGGAAHWENQMSMRIDKTRQDNAAREVEPFGASRFPRAFDAATRSYRHDAVVMYKKSAISNNSELAQRATAPGDSAAKRKKLRTAGNQPVSHRRS
jgi:hypothetical protein